MSKRRKITIIVVLALGVIYLVTSFLYGGDPLSPGKKYWCMIKDVDGLTVSNPVRVNGFIVGRIDQIKLEKDSLKVTFKLIEDVELNENSFVMLVDEGIVTGKGLLLQPNIGSSKLRSGSRIEARNEPGLMDNLKSDMKPVSAGTDTITERLNRLVTNNENLKSLQKNAKGIGKSLNVLAAKTGRLQKKVQRQIKAINTKFNALGVVSGDVAKKFDSVSTRLSEKLKTMDQNQISEISTSLSSIKEELNAVSTRLNSIDNTLGLVNNENKIKTNLNETIKELNVLQQHLKEEPKDFFAPANPAK